MAIFEVIMTNNFLKLKQTPNLKKSPTIIKQYKYQKSMGLPW